MGLTKTLNRMQFNLEHDIAFHIEETSKGRIKIIRDDSFSDLLFATLDGREDCDVEVGKFLLSRLTSGSAASESRDQIMKTALMFKKKVLDKYSFFSSVPELKKISHEIDDYSNMLKVHEKLGIPFESLMADRGLYRFIIRNHLHHRIDKTYLERGYGPKVVDGIVLFPLNSGSSFNDEDVSWVPYTEIPVDRKGIAGCTYGPFGYEKENFSAFTELRPVKLAAKSKDELPGIRLEMVTSKPTYNPLRLHKGSWGHGWIRAYVPEKDELGKETGREFLYSTGYFMGKSLFSPDPTEFVPKVKRVVSSTIISDAKWEDIRTFIDDVQGCLKDEEKCKDLAIRRFVKKTKCGTCCNFSTRIFKMATEGQVHFDGRWGPWKKLEPVTRRIGSVLRSVVPTKVSLWASRLLLNGFYPGTLIEQQRRIPSPVKPAFSTLRSS